MLSTEVSGQSRLTPDRTSASSFAVTDKTDKKMIKSSSTSRPNDYTIEKLLNTPSTSSTSFTASNAVPISSSLVLNQLTKSQIPIDIIAQTLWLQQQHHLHHKFTTAAADGLQVFDSPEPTLLTNTSSPILGQSSAHLRRYLLPQQRPNRGPRRQRTTFTHEQTLRLEMEYHVSEYITRGKRFQLAELLDLSENQIKIWFQNRRAKDKRIEKAIVEQQYRYLSSPPFHQHINVSNCSTCNYTKQQFSSDQN